MATGAKRNPIELHVEMHRRRLLQLNWYRGRTLRQVVERVNTAPVARQTTKTASPNGASDGKRESDH